jgi:hypothetical protein
MSDYNNGSENEVRGLDATGNPDIQVRSYDGGYESEGPIGNCRPTGILARGQENRQIREGVGGAMSGKATERLRKISGRPNR